MKGEDQMRIAYYLRVSTESQELDNQRTELLPFIDRRGWKLVHTFEDVMSGRKSEKDRPGFAAMLKAAHQRKFDVLVFWALDRLTREGTRATLNYLQRLESKGVGYVSYQEQWLDSTGPFKDMMISMFATLAKQERARTSERTIAGLKVARAKGMHEIAPEYDFEMELLDLIRREGGVALMYRLEVVRFFDDNAADLAELDLDGTLAAILKWRYRDQPTRFEWGYDPDALK
jgi:DNA invertase Pin-like site-specific DNA recombinase